MAMVAVAVAGAAVVGARTAAGDNELELCEDLVCELVEVLLCAKVGNVYGVLCNLGVERVDSLLNGVAELVSDLLTLGVCVSENVLLCVVFCDLCVKILGTFVFFDCFLDCTVTSVSLYEFSELCDKFFSALF